MRIGSFGIALALVLKSAAALAQNVSCDFDRTADFSRFKTYAWVKGTPAPDKFNDSRITEAIGEQLGAKGLARIDDARSADLVVAYHAAFDRDVQVTGFSSGWGGYRFGPGSSGSARAEQVVVGTLVVDVVEVRTGTIVWRGIARKDVDVKADPQKRERNIRRAVERLFKNYPPAARAK